MFLASLNEENKRLFLELEIMLAKVDGDFAQEERDVIDAHCIEMDISNNDYENTMNKNEIFEL